MFRLIHGKWSALAGVAVMMALLLARTGKTQRKECSNYLTLAQAEKLGSQPCGCSDRSALQNLIQEKEAEEKTLNDIKDNGSDQDVNQQLAQQTNKETIIGKSPYINGVCTPLVCEDWVRNHCGQIWRATFAHEASHCAFSDGLSSLTLIYAKLSSSKWNELLAESEIAARQAEVAYAQQQLDELNKKCPEPATSPGLGDRDSKKQRTDGASKRVGSNAASP